MLLRPWTFVLILMLALTAACGAKKPGKGKSKDTTAQSPEQEQAQSRIEKWLGEAAANRLTASVTAMSTKVAENAVADPSVQKSLEALVGMLFEEKPVKKRVDKVADKATVGLSNKLKLLGKALAAGGVTEYKRQIMVKTSKVAEGILAGHVRDNIMKDPRMSKVIARVMPVVSMKARLSAATLQSNLSPEMSQKIFGISIKLTVPGQADETSAKVEKWIAACDGHVENKLERLLLDIADLRSTHRAVTGLASEVMRHPSTKKELADMMARILDNQEAFDQSVVLYEQAAFDNGEKAIREAMEPLFKNPVVDQELFKTLEVLASAPGAGAIIEKHMQIVSEDKELARLIDKFLSNLLSTCGDLPI
ncbi:MAG: hypothetical protein M0R76_12925 [Proteobacteria bacterium]|nr:hypothetical protein [Pseudomonadota bacterium]